MGRKKLSETLGCSERQIRTACNHLKTTGEITTESTNKFTIYTIVKYEQYQKMRIEATNETPNKVTSNRPATDQQPTTSELSNKETNKQEEIYIPGNGKGLRNKKPADSRIPELRSYFGDLWRDRYGIAYFWKFGQYDKNLQSILSWADHSQVSLDRIKIGMKRFLASDGDRDVEARHNFGWFFATFSNWMQATETKEEFRERYLRENAGRPT